MKETGLESISTNLVMKTIAPMLYVTTYLMISYQSGTYITLYLSSINVTCWGVPQPKYFFLCDLIYPCSEKPDGTKYGIYYSCPGLI